MIDERALKAAFKTQGCWTNSYREEIREIIEAYEKAKPTPWRPIAEIMDAVNWYVIFNDLRFLKYMKYVRRDDKDYWDWIIENYPRAQFMVVHFAPSTQE